MNVLPSSIYMASFESPISGHTLDILTCVFVEGRKATEVLSRCDTRKSDHHLCLSMKASKKTGSGLGPGPSPNRSLKIADVPPDKPDDDKVKPQPQPLLG